MENRIYSVSEINNYIKNILDSDLCLASLYVRGELSNYKVYPSGHHYFTLKDQAGAIRCVMFKSSAQKLRFRPENGMKVILSGRIAVYPRDGVYQMYVTGVTPEGVGDLHIAFEQLKEKLFKEGLFDPKLKKEIPEYPEKIAVITSSAGAAVRDIIRVLGKRYPLSKVILLPVRVQGTEAPAEIAGAIKYANMYNIADIIITGRGGGSIEDLWAFNEEIVARAIFSSKIPVISAVGHEPDITISDFVSDLRAATPSNAAELAVPDIMELRDILTGMEIRAYQALKRELIMLKRHLNSLSDKRVLQSPSNYIIDRRLQIDHLYTRLLSAANIQVSESRQKYIEKASKLDALSPLKVLGRGYSIAKKENGQVVKTALDLHSGDKLKLRFKDDEVNCTVD